MKVSVVNVTPQMAKEWLEYNNVNRRLHPKRVAAYARDMENGAWQLNGEAIRFNKAGKLIDGQHRLSAIVKANTPIEIVVMRDIEDDISIFDRGRNRSTTDSLIIEGMDKRIANNTFVAIAKLHYKVQRSEHNISDYEIKRFLEKYSDELISISSCFVNHSGRAKSARISTSGASYGLAFFYAYMGGEPLEKLKRFSEVCSTGFYNDANETPAIVFRNDMISRKSISKSGIEPKEMCFKCQKAIYDFCNGYPRKMSYMSWDKPVYSNNEIFKED